MMKQKKIKILVTIAMSILILSLILFMTFCVDRNPSQSYGYMGDSFSIENSYRLSKGDIVLIITEYEDEYFIRFSKNLSPIFVPKDIVEDIR